MTARTFSFELFWKSLFFVLHQSSCFCPLPAVKAPAGLTRLSLAWHVKFQLSESLCAAIWAMTHHSMHMSTPTDPYICKDRQFLRTNPPCMQTTSSPLSNTILSRLPLHCHVHPFLVSGFRQSQVTVHLFNMAAAEHMTYQLARLIGEVSMRRRWRREE